MVTPVFAANRAGDAEVVALRAVGLAILAVVIGRVVIDFGPTSGTPFLNQRFAAFVVTAGSLAVSAHFARVYKERLTSRERPFFVVAAVAVNAVAVWGLSVELWHALGKQRWDLDPHLARQMGLSLLWAVAASLLILLGVRRESKGLRLQGLALLGMTVLKVFVVDLSSLDRAYRIASFLVLGIALLVVSFWYQKRTADARSGEGER